EAFNKCFVADLIFTISRNFIVINEIPDDRGQLLKNNNQLIANARNVYWYNPGNEQDFFLYLTWFKQKFYWMNHTSLSTIDFEKEEVIVGKEDIYLKQYYMSNSKLHFQESGEYFILSKN
ncbi:MAG: hypothetical protein WCI97_01320, partial [Bacteroidota bacterium]